jgi:hypothetical protein
MQRRIRWRVTSLAVLVLAVPACRPSPSSRDADDAADVQHAGCVGGPAAPALDHVVIVVRDIEAASAGFAREGFRLKHGRLHANNLLNRHIKFRDGTGIELMTVVGEPGDAMAGRYVQLLRDGEGGVYVALAVTAAAWPEASPEFGELLQRLGAAHCGTAGAANGMAGERIGLGRGSIIIVPPAADARPRVHGVVLQGSQDVTLQPHRAFCVHVGSGSPPRRDGPGT